VFGHECYVVYNFYKEKEECIERFFRFLNFLSLPLNVSWYFDWCFLTCAQQSNDICVSPLMCMCLPPSLLFYMCVYGYVQLFYLISPPLPFPIVHDFLTSTSLENPNLEVLQLFIVVSL